MLTFFVLFCFILFLFFFVLFVFVCLVFFVCLLVFFNSVDSDQTPQTATFDEGPHRLLLIQQLLNTSIITIHNDYCYPKCGGFLGFPARPPPRR